ncbi:MAG TPA: alpha/beta hydrolase-fold protein [Gemmatimonadaceae bacterium]|nr:alpha/beta hydrolase-fold protein [Gemmatimonadaceae bacterium]
MRRFTSHPISVLFLLAWIAPARAQQPEAPRFHGRLVIDTVHSLAIQGNLLGDPADQQIAVYLPPGYDRYPTTRYPTVYLLPSFDGSATTWTRAWPRLFGPRAGIAVVDSVMAAARSPEMIVVMPNGRNRYHGSFFVNSSVTGNWGDFLAVDLVAEIDRKYRTIPKAESRGVAGHSMGGTAAVWAAMHHPDVFGAVYGLSPCCLAFVDYGPTGQEVWERLPGYKNFDELERAYRSGDFPAMVMIALAAAISPNSSRRPFFVDLPFSSLGGNPRPLEPAYSKWQVAFPLAQLDRLGEHVRSLRGIRFDHGNAESQPLTEAARRFSRALSERAIPHTYEVYDGTHHNRIMDRLASRVLPFFGKSLVFPAPDVR